MPTDAGAVQLNLHKALRLGAPSGVSRTVSGTGRVALAVARKFGRCIGLDTGTRMAMDAEPFGVSRADFSGERDRDRVRGSDKTVEADPIAELRRIISGQ